MSAEEEVAKGKAEETQAIAAEAQKDLDEALPALDAAQKVCYRTVTKSQTRTFCFSWRERRQKT